MSRRSAGPLISKLRKRELARKRSSVSSIISACSESAAEGRKVVVLVVLEPMDSCEIPHTNWGWTANPCLYWQNGHVPDLFDIGLFIQSRVICLLNSKHVLFVPILVWGLQA